MTSGRRFALGTILGTILPGLNLILVVRDQADGGTV
jgi:hypothetical protein